MSKYNSVPHANLFLFLYFCMVGRITMLLKRKTPMMETIYPARLQPEKPSCQPGTSISEGMRKTSQITMVLYSECVISKTQKV